LTAGPALGGEKFTAVVGNLFSLQSDSTVWRVLCLAGALLSIIAAVSTNLYKSHDVAARLSTAQACNNELEGLEALLKFGELPVKEAVTLYQKYIAEIPFIQEHIA
ncbi:MAG: hypothetical protein H0X37_00645, partial [Herpetosiphonaceae bacterium]|nr:hypothetical protein [Herpetosiphonaceae bacterium]